MILGPSGSKFTQIDFFKTDLNRFTSRLWEVHLGANLAEVNWLLQQRRGSVTITDLHRREDVTEVRMPGVVEWSGGGVRFRCFGFGSLRRCRRISLEVLVG